MAVNCSVVPLAIELFGAVMAMDCNTGGVTVCVSTVEVLAAWVASPP